MKIIGPPDGSGGGILRISPPDGTLRTKLVVEPDITIIAAISNNNCIGKKNSDGLDDIPWYIPEYFRHFKNTTKGHVVVPGRVTHESILRKLHHPLPNRETIVLSQKPDFKVEGCRVVSDYKRILAVARHKKVYIIGGEQIYKLFMPLVKHLIITHVDINVQDGCAFFPEINYDEWRTDNIFYHPAVSETNTPAFKICSYVRKPRHS